MCVIIVKKPNAIIPEQKIVSACRVNPDGWGFSYFDEESKTLKTFHGYSPKGNDPDEILEYMDKYKENTQYIHLRFMTKGIKNLENCHPFSVLKTNNTDVQFMHNGTLYGFGNSTLSDSGDFVNKILKPLTESYVGLHGLEKGLEQESYNRIIEEFCGNSSSFVLYDNLGRVAFYGSKGTSHDNDSWWSSNTYSFNATHRSPPKNTYYSPSNQGNYRPPLSPPANQEKPKENTKKEEKSTAATEGAALGLHLSEAKKKKLDWAKRPDVSMRPTFFDLTKCSSFDELMTMTPEEVMDMVYELPEITAILILDLLENIYERENKERLEKTYSKTNPSQDHETEKAA